MAPEFGGGLVVIGDPSGGIGGVDGGGQGIEQFAEPAFAFAQRGLAAQGVGDRHDFIFGQRLAARRHSTLELAFKKTGQLVHFVHASRAAGRYATPNRPSP